MRNVYSLGSIHSIVHLTVFFSKVGRIAYENVVYIIELLKAKCLPSHYGLDACPINNHKLSHSVLNSVFRKIFLIKSYDVASECITFFDCSVFDAIYKRKRKFLTKLRHSENTICKLFENISLNNWILYTDILFS